MRNRLVLAVLAALIAVVSCRHESDSDIQTLQFKVAARDLPLSKLFTERPYIKIRARDGDSGDEYKVGETDPTADQTADPDFSNVFKFKFDRLKHQRWHFKVRGSELLTDNAHIGEAWVTVSDYVDKDQYIEANLNNKGYVIIKRA